MIKLRVKESEERLHESKNLYNLAGRNFKGIKIHILDIETLVEEVRDLEFSIIPRIIQLPNNELFCFGSSFAKSIAFIIDCFTMKQRKLIKIDNKSLIIAGAAYLKNSIFIWARNGKHISLWKHDLTTNKSLILAPLPIEYDTLCHNVCLEDKILISSFIFDIFVYDFEINGYSNVKVSQNNIKNLIVSGKTNAYYIESFGDIYESGFKNPYIWNKIGNSQTEITWNSSWTSYNNFIAIRDYKTDRDGKRKPNDWFYALNLSDKSLKIIDIKEYL